MTGLADDSLMRGTRLVEGAYAEMEDLTEVHIPDYTEDIGEVAFFGCVNLRSVELPRGLKIIREEAFGESGLQTVTIPESVERICEKAFYSCPDLESVQVLSEDTYIEKDAFGVCPKLREGYVAPGYPENCSPPEELLYTLLWCTCPDRHRADVCERAESFIRKNEKLVMEKVIRGSNAAALTGLADRGLLSPSNMQGYIAQTAALRKPELTAILLRASAGMTAEDFDI